MFRAQARLRQRCRDLDCWISVRGRFHCRYVTCNSRRHESLLAWRFSSWPCSPLVRGMARVVPRPSPTSAANTPPRFARSRTPAALRRRAARRSSRGSAWLGRAWQTMAGGAIPRPTPTASRRSRRPMAAPRRSHRRRWPASTSHVGTSTRATWGYSAVTVRRSSTAPAQPTGRLFTMAAPTGAPSQGPSEAVSGATRPATSARRTSTARRAIRAPPSVPPTGRLPQRRPAPTSFLVTATRTACTTTTACTNRLVFACRWLEWARCATSTATARPPHPIAAPTVPVRFGSPIRAGVGFLQRPHQPLRGAGERQRWRSRSVGKRWRRRGGTEAARAGRRASAAPADTTAVSWRSLSLATAGAPAAAWVRAVSARAAPPAAACARRWRRPSVRRPAPPPSSCGACRRCRRL